MTCKLANSQPHRLLGQGSHLRLRCIKAAVIAFQAPTAQHTIQLPAETPQINHSSGETVKAISDIVQNGYQLDARGIRDLTRHLHSLFEEGGSLPSHLIDTLSNAAVERILKSSPTHPSSFEPLVLMQHLSQLGHPPSSQSLMLIDKHIINGILMFDAQHVLTAGQAQALMTMLTNDARQHVVQGQVPPVPCFPLLLESRHKQGKLPKTPGSTPEAKTVQQMLTEYYSAVQIAGAYWPTISTCKVQDLTAACAAETLFERWCWTKGNKVNNAFTMAASMLTYKSNNLIKNSEPCLLQCLSAIRQALSDYVQSLEKQHAQHATLETAQQPHILPASASWLLLSSPGMATVAADEHFMKSCRKVWQACLTVVQQTQQPHSPRVFASALSIMYDAACCNSELVLEHRQSYELDAVAAKMDDVPALHAASMLLLKQPKLWQNTSPVLQTPLKLLNKLSQGDLQQLTDIQLLQLLTAVSKVSRFTTTVDAAKGTVHGPVNATAAKLSKLLESKMPCDLAHAYLAGSDWNRPLNLQTLIGMHISHGLACRSAQEQTYLLRLLGL